MMYFLVGILPALGGKNLSIYEKYHLKQALWWWMLFFVFLVVGIMFFFLPFVKIIPFFIFLIMFGIWLFFVKQAWEGFYTIDNKKIVFPFFYWIGNWMLEIFEIENRDESDK
jgi:hypothetical protein